VRIPSKWDPGVFHWFGTEMLFFESEGPIRPFINLNPTFAIGVGKRFHYLVRHINSEAQRRRSAAPPVGGGVGCNDLLGMVLFRTGTIIIRVVVEQQFRIKKY
jgi:hypothetical protein